MGSLSDIELRRWIERGEYTEGKSDRQNGLYWVFRRSFRNPKWRLRYNFRGTARTMWLGDYPTMTLAEARKEAKRLQARITLGHDVALEKQERIRDAKARHEAARSAITFADLADDWYDRNVWQRHLQGNFKHPHIPRRQIDTRILPFIGKLPAEEVKPHHIDTILTAAAKDAPTVSNRLAGMLKAIFNHGIKRHLIQHNPATPFGIDDAGGKRKARARWLTRSELTILFNAMKTTSTLGRENELAFKLLILLGGRKMEVMTARWEEIDLNQGVWMMGADNKARRAMAVPLPAIAVDWLRELKRLAGASSWVFPARKMQSKGTPHISPDTLNRALDRLKPNLAGMESFTIHDLRRTARTHLAELGVKRDVAEMCLNHTIKGVEGVYNQYTYFNERRDALNQWADLIVALGGASEHQADAAASGGKPIEQCGAPPAGFLPFAPAVSK
ncbi:tyrosine-type recombinase/integrase [Microbulbifer marinus]|uniref:Site-specific recombinase XerD n=1 Tax=Microbulbifer marinus TaxID=658218 RepID=A0A1H3YY83_9GAMM|nr:site-specific integrase [Microbulbifer marinus]SEA16367.1 Site-specific recombinase XerD [Microbulbifer marinus]